MPTFQCPTCRTVFSVERLDQASYRPFCSERCQLIDLYHWFKGDYRISDPIPDAAQIVLDVLRKVAAQA